MSGQVLDVPMHIAKIDEWARVSELTLHKEVLDALWFVISCFFYDSFNFFKVAKSCACLDILEVDVRVVSLGKNIAEEQEEAFVCAKLL